jgi:DNA-directed RNA polymerase subunit RPC12/RpoP
MHNAFVLHAAAFPDWNSRKRDRRRPFLYEMGQQLILPHVHRRPLAGLTRGVVQCIENVPKDVGETAIWQRHHVDSLTSNKRSRCYACPSKILRLSGNKCWKCGKYVCGEHSSKHVSYVCKNCNIAVASEVEEIVDADFVIEDLSTGQHSDVV